MKHSLKDWILATRPWSYPASTMPVAVTMAFLYWQNGHINLMNGLMALVAMAFFQAGGNVWSDYFDHKKGVDANDTYGVRILTDGLFKPSEFRILGLSLIAVACALGCVLWALVGWQILAIGAAGVVIAIGYPFFKFNALGDLVIFLAYAVLPAMGTSYVTTGTLNPYCLWVILPVGLITVAILHVNNMRDVTTDARANISTLAMKAGSNVSVFLYCFEVLAPYLILLAFAFQFSWFTLLPALTLPFALSNAKKSIKSLHDGSLAIADVDQRTAQKQLMFSSLLTIAFVVAHFV